MPYHCLCDQRLQIKWAYASSHYNIRIYRLFTLLIQFLVRQKLICTVCLLPTGPWFILSFVMEFFARVNFLQILSTYSFNFIFYHWYPTNYFLPYLSMFLIGWVNDNNYWKSQQIYFIKNSGAIEIIIHLLDCTIYCTSCFINQ